MPFLGPSYRIFLIVVFGIFKDTSIWDKVFKNGTSKICGRQLLKNLKRYDLPKADHTPSNFLKAVFHTFCVVHS